MEPACPVELFNSVTQSNVKFSVYTGDDDSTTESHIKHDVPYKVESGVILYTSRDLLPLDFTT